MVEGARALAKLLLYIFLLCYVEKKNNNRRKGILKSIPEWRYVLIIESVFLLSTFFLRVLQYGGLLTVLDEV